MAYFLYLFLSLAPIYGFFWSFFLTFLAYNLAVTLFVKYQYFVKNREALTLFDQFFMLPESFQKANCVGVQFVEKFEYKEMKEYFLRKIDETPFDRMKSQLVSKFGYHWYQKMSEK